MYFSDTDRMDYDLLWAFWRKLTQKSKAYKTEDAELLVLLDSEAELRKSIDCPSAWCSVPDAYEYPGSYAVGEFSDYLINQVKKYANEQEKDKERHMANTILSEWRDAYEQHRDAIYDAHIKPRLEPINNQPIEDVSLSFYQAARLLSDKLKTDIETIKHELVGWICGEINVIYTETYGKTYCTVYRELKAFAGKSLAIENEFDRCHLSTLSENNGFEYLAYFQGCYFSQSSIENFIPRERYITGHAIVERWLGYCGSKLGVTAKVVSCGRDMRLYWFHPFYMSTTGAPHPNAPIEMHLFRLREVECIEREDFGVNANLRLMVGPSSERNAEVGMTDAKESAEVEGRATETGTSLGVGEEPVARQTAEAASLKRKGRGKRKGQTTQIWEYIDRLWMPDNPLVLSKLWAELEHHANKPGSPITSYYKSGLTWKKANCDKAELPRLRFMKTMGDKLKKLSTPAK